VCQPGSCWDTDDILRGWNRGSIDEGPFTKMRRGLVETPWSASAEAVFTPRWKGGKGSRKMWFLTLRLPGQGYGELWSVAEQCHVRWSGTEEARRASILVSLTCQATYRLSTAPCPCMQPKCQPARAQGRLRGVERGSAGTRKHSAHLRSQSEQRHCTSFLLASPFSVRKATLAGKQVPLLVWNRSHLAVLRVLSLFHELSRVSQCSFLKP
jgi:hypothetical protein